MALRLKVIIWGRNYFDAEVTRAEVNIVEELTKGVKWPRYI